MIQVTEQRSQRCCSSNKSALREVRHRGQSMGRTRASSSSHTLTEESLLDLGRHPFLNHKGEPHKIVSLGSDHNKDCLRHRPTEHHPINSTDPAIRQPCTTVRQVLWNWPGLTRGNAGAAEEEDKRQQTTAGKQEKERFKQD